MKKIAINIDPKESREVEVLFYKYHSLMDIVVFLIDNNKLEQEQIDEKIEELALLKAQLESKKRKYGNLYKPDEFENNYTYSFDFDENKIIYEATL